jgi:hypothetical protein
MNPLQHLREAIRLCLLSHLKEDWNVEDIAITVNYDQVTDGWEIIAGVQNSKDPFPKKRVRQAIADCWILKRVKGIRTLEWR